MVGADVRPNRKERRPGVAPGNTFVCFCGWRTDHGKHESVVMPAGVG
jgi:hypothetical protein